VPASEELRRRYNQAGEQEHKTSDLDARLLKAHSGLEKEFKAAMMRGLEIKNIATIWTLFPDHSAPLFYSLTSQYFTMVYQDSGGRHRSEVPN
jgi:hypothetical protein